MNEDMTLDMSVQEIEMDTATVDLKFKKQHADTERKRQQTLALAKKREMCYY